MSDKPVIFISYSHRDAKSLDYVREFLGPLEKHGALTTWDDKQIQIGGDWRGDILSALDACRVFILLVSNHSLKSQFINEVEVKRIQGRRKKEKESVSFCPIVVTPTVMEHVDWLMKLDYRPKGDKALSEIVPKARRDREMKAIVQHIVRVIEGRPEKVKVLERVHSVDPAAAPDPAGFDYNRLPVTPYERLVGRDEELGLLDRAWADNQTNVISLIAWGGAGKTALVNEWLVRLRKDNYRGADAVLGWSFYSQGTKERSTSAEGFLDWALGKLGVRIETPSATVKGEKLAEALARQRALLVLDGVEPLQHGPGGQEGQLKDQGLRIFLRRFAAMPPESTHGLIVITSRVAIQDIAGWKGSGLGAPAPVIDLGRLSALAGAELLRANGVTKPKKGLDQLLADAVEHFEGHALALSLLASFLTRRHGGDIRERQRVGPMFKKSDARGHDHARRVMLAYETDWLKDDPIKLAVLHLMGLFDRPADADWIAALRAKPVIEGLTDPLVDLSAGEWEDAIAALRDVRLLDPADENSPGTVDAHPLVREWFGERLKEESGKAWHEAHGRLYEYLRDSTDEPESPTLEDLAPLYQAVAHGCRAGRHEEALIDVLVSRIYQLNSKTGKEFYQRFALGAFGSDIAAISNYFSPPFSSLVPNLGRNIQAWLFGEAAFCLRVLGRLSESLQAQQMSLQIREEDKDWENASTGAHNLTEIKLLLGDVDGAITSAERLNKNIRSVEGNPAVAVVLPTVHGEALLASGRITEARKVYEEIESNYHQQFKIAQITSLWGYRYCDLLLADGEWRETAKRGVFICQRGRADRALIDIARGLLIEGRSQCGLLLNAEKLSVGDCRGVQSILDRAIDGLRQTGQTQEVCRGLLVRCVFRSKIGDWGGTTRDLDEVEEIAEPGPMRLFLCDMALERARLAFAEIEAFAPLNGMLEKDNPSKPEVPSAERVAELKAEAEKQIKIADDYIQKCGYHRRDEELAELKEVLVGKRKFASLPPRV